MDIANYVTPAEMDIGFAHTIGNTLDVRLALVFISVICQHFGASLYEGGFSLTGWCLQSYQCIKGDKDNCGCYGPVILMSFILKTIERFLYDRIINHLADNSGGASWFSAKRSCRINVTRLLDEVTSRLDRAKGQKSAAWTFRRLLTPWITVFLTRNWSLSGWLLRQITK